MDAHLPGCRKKAVGFETAGACRPGYPLPGELRVSVYCTQRGCQMVPGPRWGSSPGPFAVPRGVSCNRYRVVPRWANRHGALLI